MHELMVAASLYEWALGEARELAPRQIVAIELGHDRYSCLNPDALTFGFQAIAADTELASVRLDFVEVEPDFRCSECTALVESTESGHSCGGVPRLARESALRVRSIEVE